MKRKELIRRPMPNRQEAEKQCKVKNDIQPLCKNPNAVWSVEEDKGRLWLVCTEEAK